MLGKKDNHPDSPRSQWNNYTLSHQNTYYYVYKKIWSRYIKAHNLLVVNCCLAAL